MRGLGGRNDSRGLQAHQIAVASLDADLNIAAMQAPTTLPILPGSH